jgi:hypothetical protein
MKHTIIINESEISVAIIDEREYVSLSDIAYAYGGDQRTIQNWMRTRQGLEILGLWEIDNNDAFKRLEFEAFLAEAGNNAFLMSPKKWIETTNAKGLVSKQGRGGATLGHKYIALGFASWLNSAIHYQLIKAFDRLNGNQTWNAIREASKRNYLLHATAIQKHILPKHNLPARNQGIVYASEADLLNKVIFDMTAADWRLQNPEAKGNLRDTASDVQLTVLANLESHNSELIKQGLDQAERFEILEKIAAEQLSILYERQQQAVFKSIAAKKKNKTKD